MFPQFFKSIRHFDKWTFKSEAHTDKKNTPDRSTLSGFFMLSLTICGALLMLSDPRGYAFARLRLCHGPGLRHAGDVSLLGDGDGGGGVRNL